MDLCAAKSCPSHSTDKTQFLQNCQITFHSFPLKKEIRNSWLNNMELKESDLTESSMLCSLHFVKDCFVKATIGNRKVLHQNAVPTIRFLNSADVPIDDGDSEINLFCSAQDCNNSPTMHPHLSFFGFPVDDPKMLDKWVKAAKLTGFSEYENKFLCSDHFDDDCFGVDEKGDAFLLPTAVPTKFTHSQGKSVKIGNLEDDFNIVKEQTYESLLSEITSDPKLIELVNRHDELVKNLIEKAERANQLTERIEELATKKQYLDILLESVFGGNSVPKTLLKSMKSTIKEVNELCDVVLENCTKPCVSNTY